MRRFDSFLPSQSIKAEYHGKRRKRHRRINAPFPQFTKQQEEHDKQERQRQEQGKKVKGVLQGLQDLNLSMALTQLKTVAKPEIIRQVTA